MHFEVHGRQDNEARTILLSSGLGGSGAYWAPQLPALAQHFRVITYDHRGTGRTAGDASENGGIAAMADDVMEIVETLKLQRFSFMGHALGGLIGLDIARRHPGLIDRLILINAWGKADLHSGRCFDARISLLENSGVEAFVKAQPLFLYPAVWMSENAERMAADETHGIAHFQGRENVLRRISALRAFDIEAELPNLEVETLVIATKDDLLVPYTRSVRLAQSMPKAELVLYDFGAHAVNIVYPDLFNETVIGFLARPHRSPEPRS